MTPLLAFFIIELVVLVGVSALAIHYAVLGALLFIVPVLAFTLYDGYRLAKGN